MITGNVFVFLVGSLSRQQALIKPQWKTFQDLFPVAAIVGDIKIDYLFALLVGYDCDIADMIFVKTFTRPAF